MRTSLMWPWSRLEEEIQEFLHTGPIRKLHAEYRYVLIKMETAALSTSKSDREKAMVDLIQHAKEGERALKQTLLEDFIGNRVEEMVLRVYNRNGNDGKCRARELLEDIVSA